MKKIKIIFIDVSLKEHCLFPPIEQSRPIRSVNKDNGETCDLLRLNKRQCFSQLIKRSKTSGKHHKTLCVAHKHDFSHKEVFEAEYFIVIDIGIWFLFKGKHDIESHRFAARPLCTLVRSLHDTPATA